MRLLFINQYYWPDHAATAQMLEDLCAQLVQRGHEVHVLCSRGQYDAAIQDAKTAGRAGAPAAGRPPRHEVHGGVHIHRLTATGFGKRGMIGRVLDYGSFHALTGLRTLASAWRYDLIVTLTTPPLVGVYAALARRVFRRTRHVCWVMDLHPDCEFELGLFDRRRLLPRFLDFLNGWHFRQADACVVLGPYMRDRLLAKRVRPEKIHEIPVWSSERDTVADPAAVEAMRRELQLQDQWVVMYSGNAGLLHSFDAICGAAAALASDQRLVFLFVGGGRRLPEIQSFVQEHQLTNVRIAGYVPRPRLAASLALGDVHLISLREGMGGVAVPSKLYGIMAAGRPALFVGPEHCETADTIAAADCGRRVANGDSAGLVLRLRELVDNPELARRWGANGRRAYARYHTAEIGCGQWQQLLEKVQGISPDPTPARRAALGNASTSRP